MTGILVVTHGEFGKALLATVEGILGPQDGVRALALRPGMGLEDLGGQMRESIAELDRGDGVLVLVDLFGGTPCNAGLSLCATAGVEVVTGLSMPVLVEAISQRQELKADALADAVVEKGRESLVLASRLFRQRMNP